MAADILEIKRALSSRAAEIAEHLLPNGVMRGREWEVGSVAGEAGQSLKVCIAGHKAGTWCDFAAGGDGGDLIDLWMAVKRQKLPEALDDIRGWLGLARPEFARDERRREWRKPDRPKCTVPKTDVRAYLTGERKISDAALASYRVGENRRTIVLPSLTPSGTLTFVKYLGIDLLPNGKKDTRVESDCEPILFGWQAIDPNAREITITEGEIDAMTSFDYGFPALSVPFGGGKGAKQAWIENEFERLAQFEVIYLALDMDDEGEAAVGEIAPRLGQHRCRRVKLPLKDLNECRKAGIGQAEIHRCFAASTTLDPPELQRAGAYADAVVNLFWPADGVEAGYRLPFGKVAKHVTFRPGEMTLWTGAAGSGKSQILSNCCVEWGANNARVCVASLEMAPAQTLRRMVKQATNTDRPSEPYIREAVAWIDSWLWLFGLVGKSKIARLIEVFDYARCRYGCDVFVIDSLMRLGIGSEDYEGQEKAVYELVQWTIERGVHLHLVAHARKGGKEGAGVPETEDIKGAAEIGFNAFNILGIWRNRKHEEEIRQLADAAEKGDQAAAFKLEELAEKPGVIVNVPKQRSGDWEGKFGLWFNQASYQYRSSHDPKAGHAYVTGTFREEHAA
jgi:twinkle protein